MLKAQRDAGLLAAYVFEAPFGLVDWALGTSQEPRSTQGQVEFGGVLARAIILLGPFWLTLFSARRYNALFDLRQHYSHKYNLAVAVDGFQNRPQSTKKCWPHLSSKKS